MWESSALIPHGGQTATTSTETKVNKVAVVIWEDWHQSVQTLTESLHISKTFIYRVLTENFGMKQVRSTCVPHFLTRAQMDTRVEICQEWFMLIRNNQNFFKRVVTCDENWVHYFNPLTRGESLTWKSTTCHETKKKCEVVFIVFRLSSSCFSTFHPSKGKDQGPALLWHASEVTQPHLKKKTR